LDNTDIVKNMTPYFMVQMYIEIFCQILLPSTFTLRVEVAGYFLNVVLFVYADFLYL
jgi:hypothetical protein